jgi:hypothetical protein
MMKARMLEHSLHGQAKVNAAARTLAFRHRLDYLMK